MDRLHDIFTETFGRAGADLPSPCFVLDEKLLDANLGKLEHVRREAGISLILALKGFALHAVFGKVGDHLSGAAASSLNEARLINDKMGVKAHTYCPAYLPEEFDEIASLSCAVTFNSLSEYARFGHRLRGTGVSAGLRVNPGYSEIATKLYDPADPASRLGIGPEALKGGLPEDIEGLHFHVLCENDSHTLEKVLASFEDKFGDIIGQCRWVNFGGGHLITRKGYDADHLIGLLKAFRERYQVEVILEPGAAIAWQTGYLVSRVLDIVENGGRRTAMLDVSFTCHMPDCLEMPYKPAVRGEFGTGEHYSFGGLSCLAGDYMDGFHFREPLKPGDRIIFEDMMHYTMVKTTTFNGVNLPALAILTTSGELRLLRTFGYADYRDRLS